MGPVILTLLLVAPGDAARPAPSRPGLSWALADELGRKIVTLQSQTQRVRRGEGDEVVVTQGELNSYLNLTLGPRIPEGVQELDVRLSEDRIEGHALVDLERVRQYLPPMSSFNPLSLLSGQVPVLVKGRLRGDGGFGAFEWEDVRLGGFSVPVSLLARLVGQATKGPDAPQGFDIEAPFRLPYAVQRLRIQSGRATLER